MISMVLEGLGSFKVLLQAERLLQMPTRRLYSEMASFPVCEEADLLTGIYRIREAAHALPMPAALLGDNSKMNQFVLAHYLTLFVVSLLLLSPLNVAFVSTSLQNGFRDIFSYWLQASALALNPF